jgi:predicted GNAT family acetyltransferase
MYKAILSLDEKGYGKFYIQEGGIQLGEMAISESPNDLTVYHTEVSKEAEGKGLAKIMLAAMVDYARRKRLTVIPLCTFVLAQFKRHPEVYQDVWQGDAPKG